MSNLAIVATFTKDVGDIATGLTLSDIDLYLTSINLSTGAVAVIWDGTQHPSAEVTNTGSYVKVYEDADHETYGYIAAARYTGSTSLDADYMISSSSSDLTGIAGSVWASIARTITQSAVSG